MKPNCKSPLSFLKCQRMSVQYQRQVRSSDAKFVFITKFMPQQLFLWRKNKKKKIEMAVSYISLTILMAFVLAFSVLVVPLQKYRASRQTFLIFLNLSPGFGADSSPTLPSVVGESKQPQAAWGAEERERERGGAEESTQGKGEHKVNQ